MLPTDAQNMTGFNRKIILYVNEISINYERERVEGEIEFKFCELFADEVQKKLERISLSSTASEMNLIIQSSSSWLSQLKTLK